MQRDIIDRAKTMVFARSFVSVMSCGGDDFYFKDCVCDFVYYAVFPADLTAPFTREVAFQRFGMSNTGVGVFLQFIKYP